MSEDEKKTDKAEDTSEIGRRELLAKVAVAAGALAASGMLAGALSTEAEAQTAAGPVLRRATVQRTELVGDAPLRYAKLSNGHEMTIGGKQLNDILVREGLLSNDLLGKNSVMTLKLEWS